MACCGDEGLLVACEERGNACMATIIPINCASLVVLARML